MAASTRRSERGGSGGRENTKCENRRRSRGQSHGEPVPARIFNFNINSRSAFVPAPGLFEGSGIKHPPRRSGSGMPFRAFEVPTQARCLRQLARRQRKTATGHWTTRESSSRAGNVECQGASHRSWHLHDRFRRDTVLSVCNEGVLFVSRVAFWCLDGFEPISLATEPFSTSWATVEVVLFPCRDPIPTLVVQ